MEMKLITEVQKGDVILEGSSRTEVRKVDTERCKNKVHINDKDCYERFTMVKVR